MRGLALALTDASAEAMINAADGYAALRDGFMSNTMFVQPLFSDLKRCQSIG